MELKVLRDFEAMVAREVPGFAVKYKDTSGLMKLLGFLTHPFNPKFSKYTTTLGRTVYFPSRETYEEDPERSLRVLAHEFVHLHDGRENKLFSLSYMFPQGLALIPVLAFLVLSWPHLWVVPLFLGGYAVAAFLSRKSMPVFFVTFVATIAAVVGLSLALIGLPVVLLIAAILCLVPWPAPWRAQWEVRGYTMTLAVWHWTRGEAAMSEVRPKLVEKFVGPDYFFMSWSREKIRSEFAKNVFKLRDGALQEETPYRAVYDFLYQHRLLHR